MTFKELFQKLTSRLLWGNLLAMAAVITAVIVGLFVFLDYYTYHGQTITVPDVRGQRSEVATRKLEAMGFRVEVSDTGYNSNLAADVILDQNLRPGIEVKVNRLVRLVVNSATPRQITLPDIADNCSLREAVARLEAVGFKLAPVKRVAGDKDWVYSVEVRGRTVRAGDKLNINQPLTLVVGEGLEEEVFNGNDSLDQMYFHNDYPNDSLYRDIVIE